MQRKTLVFAAFAALLACSRLRSLDDQTLSRFEIRWNSTHPDFYHMIVKVTGDRVDAGTFEVTVQSGTVISFRRNGQVLQPTYGQAYSMEGLFQVLHQEMNLAQKPELLGAPEGYTAYPMARFDDQSGRLIEYRRSVGGTANSVDIHIEQFDLPAKLNH